MTALISIVSFLAVIVVLILAHEIGHFVTAKASGVRVEEFGLGFPPRLLAIKRGETIYSLNALLLGGFVKMAGEEDPQVPGSLANKSMGVRFLVLSAGSLMNLLLPLLLFSVAFMVPSNFISGQVAVKEVALNSPAAQAGIRPNDIILRVNDRPVNNSGDLHRYIQLNLGQIITILVQHPDATTEAVAVIPRWRPPASQGAIGVSVTTLNSTITSQHYPFWQAIPLGIRACIETFVLFKNGIVSMIIGVAPVALTGPVGIAQLTGEVAKAGFSPLLEFAAFLSINLAIINIFPLPGLDGGRIAFILLEWLRRGRRISPRIERMIHLIGIAMLIAFMLAVTYRDILRIISGGSLLP